MDGVRRWLLAARLPAWRDGVIAAALLVLPWVVGWAFARHHHLDATAVTILVTVTIPLPTLWLTWAAFRLAGTRELETLLQPTPEPAPPEATLEDRLDQLSESMRQSARLVEQVSAELEARAATARRLREEADTAEALAALHKDQTEAIRRMIDAQLAATAREQEEANRRELEVAMGALSFAKRPGCSQRRVIDKQLRG